MEPKLNPANTDLEIFLNAVQLLRFFIIKIHLA